MTKRQIFVAEISLAVDAAGTQQIFYFSTEGFATKPTDTPANTFVAGYLGDPGSFKAELFSGARLTGPVRPSFGQIALTNHSGVLDGWLNYGAGGLVKVLVGEVGASYPAGFTTVLIAYSYSLIVDFKEVRVVLRDRLFQLNRPMVTEAFMGTGGLEGAGTASRKKQMVLGQPGFIPPILIDRVRQIYFVQANAADSRAFRGSSPPLYMLYEGGGTLTFEGYYGSEDSLLNGAAPSAGGFKVYGPGVDGLTGPTTESVGPLLIRLGSPPAFDVRYLAVGLEKGSSSVYAKSWTFPSLCARAGTAVTLAPGSYEKNTGNLLIEADQTYLDVMADSCAATFSAFGFDALDRFFTVDLRDPTEGSDASVFEFNQNNAKEFRRQPVPGQEQPVWQVNVNSGRTWPSSTRTSLTPEERDIFTRSPWQTTFVGSSESVRRANPGAEAAVVDVQGNDFQSDAERRTFIRRYLRLFGSRRDLLSVTVLAITPEVLAIELHSKVTVRMPRLGCDAGRVFRVVTIELNLKARTATYGLWGGDIGPDDAVLGSVVTPAPPLVRTLGLLGEWRQFAYGKTTGGGGGGRATLGPFVQKAYGGIPPGIQFIAAANSSSAETLLIPAHNAGDLIVAYAKATAVGGDPALPAGWTTAVFSGLAGAWSSPIRIYYIRDTAGTITTLTKPTGTANIAFIIYRNASGTGLSAITAETHYATREADTPALTGTLTGGSWVIAGTDINQGEVLTGPTTRTIRAIREVGIGGGTGILFDTAAVVTSYAGGDRTTWTGFDAYGYTFAFEILNG